MNWSDWFYYDETSPTFLRWAREVRGGKGHKTVCYRPGDIAGSTKGIYAVVRLQGVNYQVHRVVYELCHAVNIPTGMQIDHIDTNKKNNSINNLRIVTPQVNARNVKAGRRNTSGKVGVSFFIHQKNPITYCAAVWHGVEGKKCSKVFSTQKHGLLPAFAMACAYREKMIAELNAKGAGYTGRHGK